ncbi:MULTISPECIES: conjugative transposon protein TraK [Hymenobacter]|uniref:Bacteroides conjugative transposon TraK protein n=1 Tax=Hymenobacter mucosus TaxID=1411120 RepID=A0A239AWV1_9BACT|nr:MULTISPECIES: conjugative transposon protein TraK [Hymenobacter]MDF7815522.1 conjugative transposon protein TraK [Hymenobacter sp. YC55]SNS00206.1 Bacteroides conjugative transposon TraK protein [Hymenobacter mucosus]
MFESLKTIDSAFKQVKTLAIIFIVSVLTLAVTIAYFSFQNSAAAANRIYVLEGGQLLTAGATDARANRPVEARSHVKRFHELFFSLDPDQKAIDGNINQALYLADNSAKREYENLKERGFYNDLISANISMEITVDSVVLSNTRPITARTFAHQRLIRATSYTNRDLVADCTLRDVTRSENNPHGFIMENWRVVQNNTLSTIAR